MESFLGISFYIFGFDLVSASFPDDVSDDVLVDCLLPVASAQWGTSLPAYLRSGHDASLFDRVCAAMISVIPR